MSQQPRLEVFDKNGWRKIYPIAAQPIIHLGSDPRNDVILASDYGGQVAPIHAQLITSGSTAGYQLVNLADTPIVLDTATQQSLPARSAMALVDGQQFVLGEFTLVFYGTGGFYSGPVSNNSPHIGLTLLLAQTELKPGQAVSGLVTVQNLSTDTGVQFEVEMAGLDDDCFDLEPGPLLSSGAAKDVLLHLYHRGPKPAAEQCRITIRATAPRAYPGEQVEVSQTIHVLPYYRHQLKLLSPGQTVETPQFNEELLPKGKAGPPPRREQPAISTQTGGPAYTTPVAVTAGLADAAVLSQGGSQSPTPSQPSAETAGDWWGTPVETPPTPATPDTTPPGDTAADWWGAPTEAQPLPQPEPEASADTIPVDWWTTPAAPEPAGESASPQIPEQKVEESLPTDVVEASAEEMTAAEEVVPEPSAKTESLPTETEASVAPQKTEPPLTPQIDETAATVEEEPSGINKLWAGLRSALPFSDRQRDTEKAQTFDVPQDTGAPPPGEPAMKMEPPEENISTRDEPISNDSYVKTPPTLEVINELPAEAPIDLPVESEAAPRSINAAPPPPVAIEQEIVEPLPASETAREETPPATTADVVTTTAEGEVGIVESVETSPETAIEESPESVTKLVDTPTTPEAADWWGEDNSADASKEEPPPDSETPGEESPETPTPPTAVPDWWSTEPGAETPNISGEEAETTITAKADSAAEEPDKNEEPPPPVVTSVGWTAEDNVPDWWSDEPADKFSSTDAETNEAKGKGSTPADD